MISKEGIYSSKQLRRNLKMKIDELANCLKFSNK